MKTHPATQKAINAYAARLLQFYRKIRKSESFVPAARLAARIKANQTISGNVYVTIAARQLSRYPRY